MNNENPDQFWNVVFGGNVQNGALLLMLYIIVFVVAGAAISMLFG